VVVQGHAGVAQLEGRYHALQRGGLLAQAFRGGGAFFHQGSILLRAVVQRGHGLVHFADAHALLVRGRIDFRDQVVHAAYLGHDVVHGGAGLIDQAAAGLDLLVAVGDQLLDFLGGLGAALGQRAHFAGHHGEASALFTRPGGFHRRVERQDVGLEGNAVDHADDVGDLVAGLGDVAHGVHHALDHLTTAPGHIGGRGGQHAGLTGAVGVVLHGAGHLLHGRGGLLQGAGLTLGAAGQVHVARGDFGGRDGDAVGGLAHLPHHADEALVHALERVQQLACLVATVDDDVGAQIASGHGLGQAHGAVERPGHAVAQHPAHRGGGEQGDQAGGQHQGLVLAVGVLGGVGAGHGLVVLMLDEIIGGGEQLGQQRAALLVHAGHGLLALTLEFQPHDLTGHGAVFLFDLGDGGDHVAVLSGGIATGDSGVQVLDGLVHILLGFGDGGLFQRAVGWFRHQHQIACSDGTAGGRAPHRGGQAFALVGALEVVGEAVVGAAEGAQGQRGDQQDDGGQADEAEHQLGFDAHVIDGHRGSL